MLKQLSFSNFVFHHINFRFNSAFFILFLVVSLSFPVTELYAQNDNNFLPVIVEKVLSRDISMRLQTSGDVFPFQGADIYPKISGEVIKMTVREGDKVSPGDLLAEIDHRILDAQLEQAKAAVTVAKSAVDAQSVLVKTSQSGLISAKAQAEAVKAQVVNLSATRKRFEELYREGAISQQQLDDVIAKHDATKAQLISAESGIRQAEDSIQTNRVNLKMRRAQLLQAEANLHSAEVQRENAFVRAPFAGLVTTRFLDPGAMANVAKPIFRVEQMNPVKVIGSLVEKDLMTLTAGVTRAEVKAASINKAFWGQVNKVYPAISAQTRTGQFEVILDNPELLLRSGMYATIMLELQTEKNAVVVSKDSLLSHAGQMFAIRVNENKTAERVKVRLGIVQGSDAQILEGLKPGDLIVSQSPELVKVGSKVNPILAEARK
ncbi:MAG: HlyD family secretion protein [Clostridiales bacterium]|nr:HlyD family secretion protein [Clostridiales bacterium]MDN5281846.1 HlyD family secretion protein [Candidatus Ozemobacter sp.]